MPRLPLIEPEDASPEVLALYRRTTGWLEDQPGPRAEQAKASMRVPQPWRALAHSPHLAELVFDGASYILSDLPWAKEHYRQRQLLIMAVMRRRNCEFAYVGHWPHCESAGISREVYDLFATLEGLETAKTSPLLSEEEQLLITYADELANTGEVSKELFQQLLEHYGPQGAVEITVIVGYRLFTSAFINAFDLEDD